MKPTINHADLLRLSKQLELPTSDALAALLGFAVKQQALTKEPLLDVLQNLQGKESGISKRRKKAQDKTQKNKQTEKAFSYWYLAAREPQPEAIKPTLIKLSKNKTRKPEPRVTPLLSLAQAHHRLQQELATTHRLHRLDIPRAVERIAKNQTIEHLPYKQRQRLPDTLCLLLDIPARLEPALPEINQYFQAAWELFGRSRLRVFSITDAPNSKGELIISSEGEELIASLLPNEALLYIGDKGAFSLNSMQQSRAWNAFYKRLQCANISNGFIEIAKLEEADKETVQQLMAVTMRCEGPSTDRIRHMRLALAQTLAYKKPLEAALAEELLVWNHPDMTHPGQIADVTTNLLNKWKRVYSRIPADRRNALEKSLYRWRQTLPMSTAAMEQLKGASLGLEEIVDPESINQLFLLSPDNKAHQGYLSSRKTLIHHLEQSSKDNIPLQQATANLRSALVKSAPHMPTPPEKLYIRQQGASLNYCFKKPDHTSASSYLELTTPVLDAQGREMNQSGEISKNVTSCLFDSPHEQLQFLKITKPDWAERLWQNEQQLYAAHTDGSVFQLQTSQKINQKPHWKGIENAWQWASDYGIDKYGLWATLSVKNVEFSLRWIPPGEFLMGSPEDEKGRSSDETQHQVQLTQGYWLAETTCTQRQWQAIMGGNPSDPKNQDLPVNNISWDDCKEFTKKLQAKIPSFHAQLPTEAQWEYACRAGTTTAYWWGDEFDESKANSSYSLEQENNYPRNLFGLRSMSGNLLEWCNDWEGSYADKPVIDPQGASSVSQRVLRGGGWIDDARILRSAYRNAGSPDDRYHDIGLRLAGGFDPQAGSEGKMTADRHGRSHDSQ